MGNTKRNISKVKESLQLEQSCSADQKTQEQAIYKHENDFEELDNEDEFFGLFGINEKVDKKKEPLQLEEPNLKKPPMPRTLCSYITGAEASLLKLKQYAQDVNVLDTEVTDIPPSFFESEKVKKSIQIILDIPNQLSGKPDVDSVIVDTNKRIQLYVFPLNKRGHKGFAGLSREKVSIITEPVRLNDVGLPMHPLEIEVTELIERVQGGEKPFDGCSTYKEAKAQFDDIKNTVDYLKKYFGRYLNVFNGGKGDYLYQVDLQKIDAKFRNSLRMYLSEHGQNISDYVPDSSKKTDSDIRVVKEQGLTKYAYRINNIMHRKRLRAS